MTVSYPSDPADRQQLADALARRGYMPTQGRSAFDPDKIEAMAQAMADGTFDWAKSARQAVILGAANEVLGGHHRLVAAELAGIDLRTVQPVQVRRTAVPVYRQAERWIDVLP